MIRNGRIPGNAVRTIDATDQGVAPGFIGMHTHSDLPVFAHPEEDSKRLQGITTALIGQDRLSVAPIDDAKDATNGKAQTYNTDRGVVGQAAVR